MARIDAIIGASDGVKTAIAAPRIDGHIPERFPQQLVTRRRLSRQSLGFCTHSEYYADLLQQRRRNLGATRRLFIRRTHPPPFQP